MTAGTAGTDMMHDGLDHPSIVSHEVIIRSAATWKPRKPTKFVIVREKVRAGMTYNCHTRRTLHFSLSKEKIERKSTRATKSTRAAGKVEITN